MVSNSMINNKNKTSSSENSGFKRLCKKILRNRSKGEEDSHMHTKPLTTTSASSSEQKGRTGLCFERVFSYFDENGDGRVSAEELQRAVRAVGGELTAEEAEMAVRLSDSDGDGMLGLEDFTKMMEEEKGMGVAGEGGDDELRETFGRYEMEGTGHITPKSLKRMLSRLGESTTIGNCEAMISRFDLNGDGVLCFEEFKIMMA